MNENRILQQMTAIFSAFMVFFYMGVGIYLIFFAHLNYPDKALLVIIGSAFILLGLYRAYTAYVKIVEFFFKKDKNNE